MPDGTPLTFDSAWLRAFRPKLLAWYRHNARDLPWRRRADPYATWVSEIMLQQTQVEAVKPYFDRFLAALPTIAALAQADEQAVLRLWEGLGYYRRARQLHQAAKVVMAEHGGQLPRDPLLLGRLPGIGRYTAGAILSIAFDQRAPILEANTIRLLSRLFGYGGDTSSSAGQKILWAAAETVLPRRAPGRFNQALMELGSEVCRRTPRCGDCPIAGLCRARRQGLEGQIPRAKIKRPPEEVREAAVVVRRRGRVLVLQWPEGRRWAGLWDFPRFPLASEHPAEIERELLENVRRLTGVVVCPGAHLRTVRHGVTRFRITLACYEAAYVSSGGPAEIAVSRWLRPAELRDYPLSSTGRELARLVQK